MSKSVDAHSPKRAQPDTELEPMAPAGSGGFAPVPARRTAALQPEVTAAPLITGGETTQYQVPLDLLVLARNKEKDKARSVAVTPVAPKPNSDEPPPSSELSGLRTQQPAEPEQAAPAISGPAPAPISGSVPSSASRPVPGSSSGRVPAVSRPVPAATPLPSLGAAPLAQAGDERRSGAQRAPAAASSTTATLALVVLVALCVFAGYYAVELLRLF